MTELPRQTPPGRRSAKPLAVTLAGGESVTVWSEDGDVVLVADLGRGRDGVMVKMPAAAAAYVAGALAQLAGVRHG
jgi:hypothetical protein